MKFGTMRNRLGAIIGISTALVVAAPGMVLAQAEKMAGAELLPPNAKPGECYARVFVPAAYKTETAQVITREASERVEIVPARYEKVAEQVLVREASKKVEVVPETYDWVEERVLVKPASERIVEVPAVYETSKRRWLTDPPTASGKRVKDRSRRSILQPEKSCVWSRCQRRIRP